MMMDETKNIKENGKRIYFIKFALSHQSKIRKIITKTAHQDQWYSQSIWHEDATSKTKVVVTAKVKKKKCKH